ncbi:unnamed protein product, partial [Cladocopium goreaui]
MVVAGPKAKASGLLASLETPQPRAAFRQLFRQPDMAAIEFCLVQEEESSVHAVAFSPDGQYIVVGCGDKSVKVWSLTEQLQSFSGHEDTVQSVAVTADGRAVSCSHDKTLRVWRLPRHPFLYAQVPFVSAPVYMPRPVARAPGSPQAMLSRDRMEEFHERLKNAEAMNKQMREQLEEEHSDE